MDVCLLVKLPTSPSLWTYDFRHHDGPMDLASLVDLWTSSYLWPAYLAILVLYLATLFLWTFLVVLQTSPSWSADLAILAILVVDLWT
jgi:hypothetical protein